MKTFRFYLCASKYFLDNSTRTKLSEEREFNHIASVLLSWIALETYINTLFESLKEGTRIKEHIKAFLKEKEMKVDDDGRFKEITIRPSTTKKIIFIINYFSKKDVKKFKQKKIWKDITSLEDLRDKIVHYKEANNITISYKKSAECRRLVLDFIDYLRKILK
ncbi:MAG: hypothetical protein HY364_04725 [Candidatus Aenigmarchaeota archaeon]|nr:hypothetical protein [Candidatus Aenigmarchaeota archaeon]